MQKESRGIDKACPVCLLWLAQLGTPCKPAEHVSHLEQGLNSVLDNRYRNAAGRRETDRLSSHSNLQTRPLSLALHRSSAARQDNFLAQPHPQRGNAPRKVKLEYFLNPK